MFESNARRHRALVQKVALVPAGARIDLEPTAELLVVPLLIPLVLGDLLGQGLREGGEEDTLAGGVVVVELALLAAVKVGVGGRTSANRRRTFHADGILRFKREEFDVWIANC